MKVLAAVPTMRSSRALCTIRNGYRTSFATSRIARYPIATRHGYCSSCEQPEVSAVKKSPAQDYVKKSVSKGPVEAEPSVTTKLPDHRHLGVEQELFTTSIYSPGSPLFLPRGARLFNKLINFIRAQYRSYGFEEVITPTIYKKALWEKSGHWKNYANDMYSVVEREKEATDTGPEAEVKGEGEGTYGLKPMNCPGHCLLFDALPRSWRELPVRFADFSPLHRNEISGALSGLTRVRRFHQDDGHIFCRPEQVGDEISSTLSFVRDTYSVLGITSYRFVLSTRPEDKYIGTLEEWDEAEANLKSALDSSGKGWTLNAGDGAFYGPKIDIIVEDAHGKELQTATIQLDFQLPKRFDLSYENENVTSAPSRPVLIHRAVLGSVERMMALLIEQYSKSWPFWLNPRQVMVMPVNDTEDVQNYTQKVVDILREGAPSSTQKSMMQLIQPSNLKDVKAQGFLSHELNVDVDFRARAIPKKVAIAKSLGYGVLVTIGNREIRKNVVNVNFSKIPNYEVLGKHPDIKYAVLASKDYADAIVKGIDVNGQDYIQSLKNRLPSEPDATLRQLQSVELDPKVLGEILRSAVDSFM